MYLRDNYTSYYETQIKIERGVTMLSNDITDEKIKILMKRKELFIRIIDHHKKMYHKSEDPRWKDVCLGTIDDSKKELYSTQKNLDFLNKKQETKTLTNFNT